MHFVLGVVESGVLIVVVIEVERLDVAVTVGDGVILAAGWHCEK